MRSTNYVKNIWKAKTVFNGVQFGEIPQTCLLVYHIADFPHAVMLNIPKQV